MTRNLLIATQRRAVGNRSIRREPDLISKVIRLTPDATELNRMEF
jgi:hypothetical protein